MQAEAPFPDPALRPATAGAQPLRELLLGGQKSGKSRLAESRAAHWLASDPGHRALLLATAEAGDAEMQARIDRHRADRARRVPRLLTVETGADLGHALRQHAEPQTMLIVDCLTLWLTRLLMPLQPPVIDAPQSRPAPFAETAETAEAAVADLLDALAAARGPVVLVSNEIGLGVIPLGRETRAFVDMLGSLNQRVAAACERVTLLAAGLPLLLKDEAVR